MALARFMANPIGRGARIIVGLALIAVGVLEVKGAAGVALAAVGTVAFLAGAINFCLLAPLIRAPFMGRDAARHQ